MADYSLVVLGHIVTPNGCLRDGWIAITDGRIAAIGTGTPPAAGQVHDASGCYVMPGVIDGQTHAGSQFGIAGLEQTTRSAIAGGITTIVDMPYDEPDVVATLAVMATKIAAVDRFAHCNVALYATITNDSDLSEVPTLIDAGACAFKVSSYENHPTRFPKIRADRVLALLKRLAETDIPTGLHNEDQEIVDATMLDFRKREATGPESHDPSRPEVAELVATAAFLEMGRAIGAHVHIVHMTSLRGFELVRRYQAEGARATGEMCVHYLHFDAAADMPRLGALMKVNPPIRSGVREKLWAELGGSGVSFVSSDHSAWPLSRKQAACSFDAPAGIPGLETLLPALVTGLHKRGKDAVALAARHLCEGPARFFGLWPRKGGLMVGADADVAVIVLEDWVFDASKTHDGLNWSPFDGETFGARVAATFVRGKLVWDGVTVVGAPGDGTFVARKAQTLSR
ncbi:dihydroorotase family protein [Beijerinckia sp. L45]|uniref:dihydroorotase n=1 Tax=Beijerinckia sp. L45 TaxID=1641855 RepID=UPI00131D497E|nr:dihydroorotase family protein [Beijerinckia sp. L45]